jgi:hypothetical protein
MSAVELAPAIALLEAEIERLEDEIVAIREVIAMLRRRDGGAEGPAKPPPPVRRRKGGPPEAGHDGKSVAHAGFTVTETRMLDILDAGPLSADMAEEICNGRQGRHDKIFRLKGKLAAQGRTILWTKGVGYTLAEMPAEAAS